MRRVLLGLLATLAIALAAAGYFRVAVLDLLLRQGLAYAGISDPEFRIAAVTLSHAEIVDLRMGPELALGRLRVDYQPMRLARGRLDGVFVEALRLDLTVPQSAAIERLTAPTADGEAPTSSGYGSPPVELRDAALRWPSPLGPVWLRLDGRLEAAAGNAMRGRFDVAADAEAGRLQGQATIERQADGGLTARLSVRPGDLAFERAKLVGLAGEAEVSADPDGRLKLAGEVQVESLHLDGTPVAKARTSIRLDGAALTLSVAGEALEAPFDLALAGALDLAQGRLQLERAVLTADPGYRSLLSPALGLPVFNSGTAHLYLAAGGATLPTGSLPSTPAELLALLQQSGLQGTATLTAEGWSSEGWFDGLALVGGLDFAADGERIVIRLATPALFEAARLSSAAMAGSGLPQALHPLLAQRLSLGIEPDPSAGLAITLAGGAAVQAELRGALRADFSAGDRLVFDATARLAAALWPHWRLTALDVGRLTAQAREFSLAGQSIRQLDLDAGASLAGDAWSGAGTFVITVDKPAYRAFGAKQLTLELPLAYILAGERATVRLQAPGSLHLRQGRHRDLLELPADLRLSLSPGPRPLVSVRLSPPLRYDASLSAITPVPLDLLVAANSETVPVRLGGLGLNLEATTGDSRQPTLKAALSASEVELPKHRIRGEAVTLDLKLDDPSPTGTAGFRIGRLLYADPTLPLPPFSLAGNASLKGGTAAFDATVLEADGPLRLIAAGRYDLAAAQLNGKVALPPTDLATLLPSLRRLYPPAGQIKALHGRVAGRADINWAGGAMDGTAEVVLDDVGIDSERLKLAGLAGTIALAELAPPATDRPQHLTIRAVEAPLQARDVAMALRLSPVEGRGIGRIHIDKATAVSDFARLAIDEAVLDPLPGEARLRLRVSELDLGQLFRLAGVDGLSGTGSLSGAIPLSYGPAGLTIEPGSLVAAGPGVIRFASEAAKRALSGGGEQVQLLLRALENFQYQALSVGLEKAAGGATSAKLSIRGHNPDVLEGYPFALNIDLSGNFDSLLATVLEAYDLSGRALRATVK